MMIKLNDVELKTGKVGQFIRPGVNELTIKDVQLKQSQNNQSYSPIFLCETRPITVPGWTGFENAAGQIGKIAANRGYYIKTDEHLRTFLSFVMSIANALGKTEEAAAIEAEDLPELITLIKPLFCDGQYARYFVCGEEYVKQGGKKGLKLSFPNINGVESLTTTPSTLPVYNESNKNHYKKLVPVVQPETDLPF